MRQCKDIDGRVGRIDTGSKYDEDYFLHGKQTGKSLYEDYRWLPDLTIPMAQVMAAHLGIYARDVILDFGCARGYVVRAFREMGYNAWGYDISKWALDNADEVASPYLIHNDLTIWSHGFDWVIAKDVLEHVEYISSVVDSLLDMAYKGVFVVVPLSMFKDCDYIIGDYEKDVTHIHRMNLAMWAEMFMRPGWSVEASYRVVGIKDNWYKDGWERGNGFITARRIVEDGRFCGTRR